MRDAFTALSTVVPVMHGLALTGDAIMQGTNGGVTLTGLAASLVGGLFTGLVFWSMGAVSPTLYTVPFQQEPAIGQWSLILLGELQPGSQHCHACAVSWPGQNALPANSLSPLTAASSVRSFPGRGL